MTQKELLEKNQKLISDLRRKPIPLSDIIPHLQDMADQISYLDSVIDVLINTANNDE
jgi:uncharacterized protein YoxC